MITLFKTYKYNFDSYKERWPGITERDRNYLWKVWYCAVPRAVPIFESVISIDLLNSLIENTGGDNKEVIFKRINEIKDITLDSFNLANKTWSMRYENE